MRIVTGGLAQQTGISQRQPAARPNPQDPGVATLTRGQDLPDLARTGMSEQASPVTTTRADTND